MTTTTNMNHSALKLPLTLDLDRPMYEATLHEQESPQGTWGIVFQGRKDKAEQIMTAVNSHQALVEALEQLFEFWDNGTPVQPGAFVVKHARAALTLARGGNK